MGNQQQPVAYHDQTIDENLRTKYVRSLFHRNGLLAGLLYLPDTDCHVHEAVQLQGRYHLRTVAGRFRRITVFPGSHAERILGVPDNLLYHRNRMCFLETAANPYVTALGNPETAPRRLNLAQSFNGLGAFIAAMFLSKLVLSGEHYTRTTLPADYPGGWEAYIQFETDSMKQPYLLLALLLIIIAVVFIVSKLPRIQDEEHSGKDKDGKLIDFSVLKRSHLRWGAIAQFFYNGGQTAINSLFLVYCCSYAGLSESVATTFFGLYMLAFLLGRWIGTLLMVKFRPQDMLLINALLNVILCGVIALCGGTIGLYAMLAVSFFMSIMYPTQFSLALKDLGDNTKSGAAFLVMAIVGNACLPQLTLRDAIFRSYLLYRLSHSAGLLPLLCLLRMERL